MIKNLTRFLRVSPLGLALLLSLTFSCVEKEQLAPDATIVTKHNKGTKLNAVLISEGFESGSKGSYTAGNVTLSSGTWNFSDALIGNLSTDRKSGFASARIINSGKITMLFNAATAGTVTVKHAKFGTDVNSSWELWRSTNNGSTWTKVGSTIITSSTTLSTVSFTVNSSVATRFEIRKVSGASARINIDDIIISDYGTGTTTGGTTGTTTGGTTDGSTTGSTTGTTTGGTTGGDTGGSPGGTNVHLTMGNPSAATANTATPGNYLLEKAQYALAYSRDLGRPIWTSWHLSPSWLGSTPRQDDFRNDTSLPSGWYQVLGSDYSGSGFDRGHMCPSADRTLTVTDNSSTFLMTNMIPQAPDNNQGPWAVLEGYARTLVNAGNEVYIISGGYGSGGTGLNGAATYVAAGRVHVPARTWKVLVVLPQGSDDVNRVTTSTRVIAVDMPNTQGIRNNTWGSYRVTVNSIEQQTGFNIMSSVPAAVQDVLEAQIDAGPTS